MRLSSARTIASARRRFVAGNSTTFSSTVFRAMRRNANTSTDPARAVVLHIDQQIGENVAMRGAKIA